MRRFVAAFEIVECDEATTRTLLPDTGLVIGFRYKGTATLIEGTSRRLLPSGAVTGLRGSVRQMHTSANGGIVLAKFRAGGAVSFIAEALHHLFGLTCAVEEFFDGDVALRTSRRIGRAGCDLERVAIFEQFLFAHYRPTSPDPIVSGALRDIDATAGAGRVRSIALALRVSQDTLEKRFRRVVGATPKQFSSIVRLRRALDLLRRGAPIATLALDAGYYDQPHFTRHFRTVTGAAPAHFIRKAKYC